MINFRPSWVILVFFVLIVWMYWEARDNQPVSQISNNPQSKGSKGSKDLNNSNSESSNNQNSHFKIKRKYAPIEEATEGIIVDDIYLYVISRTGISKWRSSDAQLVGYMQIAQDLEITGLSCGKLFQNKLYITHNSNREREDNALLNSIEIWDATSTQWIGSIKLPHLNGRLIWLERYNDIWFAGVGQEIVQFDDKWRITSKWLFPKSVLNHLGEREQTGGLIDSDNNRIIINGYDGDLYILHCPNFTNNQSNNQTNDQIILKLSGIEKTSFTEGGIYLKDGNIWGINNKEKAVISMQNS